MIAENQHINEQELFYDQLWEYKSLNSLDLRRYVKILDYFSDIKRKIKQPRILDLGCGTGKFTAIVGHFGPAVGLELSPNAVEKAQKLYPHVTYVQGNALEYQLEPSHYDVVISQEVIEHVWEQERYLEICIKALKPKGYLILTTPNKNVLNHMPNGSDWSNQPIENILTRKELKALVKKKFKILSYDSIIMNFGTIGVYKLINASIIIGVCNRFGFKRFREHILGKLGYGLHQCILAQKVE